jgi:hypothetical protein
MLGYRNINVVTQISTKPRGRGSNPPRQFGNLLCLFCSVKSQNLRCARKFFVSRRSSDSDIPRAKAAKVAKLEIYFVVPWRPLRALREIFRISVAALLR